VTAGGLKPNPEVMGKLTEAAGQYLATKAGQTVSRLGGQKSDQSKSSNGDDGGDDSKGFMGATAEKMAEGSSPAKAVLSGVGTSIKEKVKGIFSKGSGGGKPKFSNVIEDSYVGVPVSTAYNQWTQFQEFSKFTKAVTSVDSSDEVSTNWKAKVGWFNRSWSAKVLEQVPDERIKWTSEGGKGTTKGVVTFHELGDSLTLICLNLEVHHKGFIEQLGRPFKTAPRRVHKDLKLYRRFIVTEGEETGAWRGEIRDGEVVSDGEEQSDEAEDQAEQPEEQGEEGDGEGEGDLEEGGSEPEAASEEEVSAQR
jgi:uncharacterized membrane protein